MNPENNSNGNASVTPGSERKRNSDINNTNNCGDLVSGPASAGAGNHIDSRGGYHNSNRTPRGAKSSGPPSTGPLVTSGSARAQQQGATQVQCHPEQVVEPPSVQMLQVILIKVPVLHSNCCGGEMCQNAAMC